MPRYEAIYERVETVRFVFPHANHSLLGSSENLSAAHAEAYGRVLKNATGPATIRDCTEWRQIGWTEVGDDDA